MFAPLPTDAAVTPDIVPVTPPPVSDAAAIAAAAGGAQDTGDLDFEATLLTVSASEEASALLLPPPSVPTLDPADLLCHGGDLDALLAPTFTSPPDSPPLLDFDFDGTIGLGLDDVVGLNTAPCGVAVPDTWSPCDHCAASPWADGGHVGHALADHDGVVRCHIVEVDPSTAEYAAVVLPLVQHGVSIVEVQRVQNHRLYTRYHGKEMSEALMPWETETKDLWHGTTVSDLEQMLLEGLDQRMSARGHFGRGLYFSDHPGKAHRYTTKRSGFGGESGGVRTMLRCRVQLGRTKEYPPGVNDTSLLREPAGYDSVRGNISGQNEMVVYDNDRVLIEYVVRYTVDTPVVAPTSMAAQSLAAAAAAAPAPVAMCGGGAATCGHVGCSTSFSSGATHRRLKAARRSRVRESRRAAAQAAAAAAATATDEPESRGCKRRADEEAVAPVWRHKREKADEDAANL